MSDTITKKGDLLERLSKINASLLDEIKALEQVSQEIDLEKIDYVAPTDDELLEVAKSTLKEKYDTQRNSATSSSEGKKFSLSKSIEDLQRQAQEKKAVADSNYSKAIKDVENQAVKRGIQRSSIALSSLADLADKNVSEKTKIDEDSDKKKEDYLAEIEKVNDDLHKTLERLDENEKSEIAKELKTLQDERDRKVVEAIKYNNEITEKEKKYETSKDVIDIQSTINKIRGNHQLRMAGIVLDYYRNFEDNNEALADFANDDQLAVYLGNYYDYVLNVLKNRIPLTVGKATAN